MHNLPEKILVGMTKETVKDLTVANLLPKNTNKSFKIKEQKFRADHQEVIEIDNELYPGFYIIKPDRANWSRDKPWYIADPRGFAFRLTQNNLENIISTSLISNGIIQESCRWSRIDEDYNMCLISESSPEYDSTLNTTNMIKNRVSMDQVDIGDIVELQNGLTGVYMGVHSLYFPMEIGIINHRLTQKTSLRRQIIKLSVGQYYYQTDTKILRITSKSSRKITEQQAADMMNQEISTVSTYFGTGTGETFLRNNPPKYYHSSSVVRFVYPRSTSKFSLALREIDQAQAVSIFYSANSLGDCTSLVLEDKNGDQYLVNAPRSISNSNLNPPMHHQMPIMAIAKLHSDHIDLKSARPYILTRSRSKISAGVDINDFQKFYKIVKVVKDREFV